jgi:glycosyltransferase involved in cell wall biosynthesis
MPTIGVAICCYKKHTSKLLRLLDSIATQTLLPTQVVVSSSSCEPSDIPALPEYPFPVTLIIHRGRKNAAQNRNIAVRALTTDIVSFIDADDLMLPRRLEAVHKAYMEGARFIVHNYTTDFAYRDNNDDIVIQHGVLLRAPSLCIIHRDNIHTPLHHAHSSIDRNVLQSIQYREESSYERREDAVFCGDVVHNGTSNAYIANPLSIYDMDGSTWA